MNKMGKYLIENLKQKFWTGKLILVLFGVAFCICLDTWNQIPFLWKAEKGTITGYYYFFNSYVFGGQYLPFFALALSVIIGTVDYCRERQSGVDKYVIQRLGSVKDYICSKVYFSLLSSNFIYLMGMLIFFLFSLVFQPFYNQTFNMETQGFPYYSYLVSRNGWSYLGVLLYLAFLRTTMWNMIALWISSFVKSIYVTIAAPILVSYVLSRIFTILRLPAELRFDYWLSGRSVCVSEKQTLVMCTVVVVFISMICVIKFKNRVMSDEENR